MGVESCSLQLTVTVTTADGTETTLPVQPGQDELDYVPVSPAMDDVVSVVIAASDPERPIAPEDIEQLEVHACQLGSLPLLFSASPSLSLIPVSTTPASRMTTPPPVTTPAPCEHTVDADQLEEGSQYPDGSSVKLDFPLIHSPAFKLLFHSVSPISPEIATQLADVSRMTATASRLQAYRRRPRAFAGGGEHSEQHRCSDSRRR